MAPSRGAQYSPNANAVSSGRAFQACAGCKRRKVRCGGGQPCAACLKHDLVCVYSSPSQGRSRIGAAERGSVISELGHPDSFRSSSSPSAVATSSISSPAALNPEESPQPASSRSADISPVVDGIDESGADMNIFYDVMIPEFMKLAYPIAPVLEVTELQAHLAAMSQSQETAALIYACTGFTLFLIQNDKPCDSRSYDEAQQMISHAIKRLEPVGFADPWPRLPRVLSRLFIGKSMMILHKNDLAFYYIHQAVSMLLMKGIETFLGDQEDRRERARRERIYWLCFIDERHLCLEEGTLVCLEPLPNMPAVYDTSTGLSEGGWNLILDTFKIIDHDFARFWTGDRTKVTLEWIQAKQVEVNDSKWMAEVSKAPFTQQADLILTRQWLRTLLWQMAMSNVLLSPDSSQPNDILSLSLPLHLSTQLKDFLSEMSYDVIEVHGIGMMEKLFGITTTIADVIITLMRGEHHAEALRSVQDLFFVKEFLFNLPRLLPVYREMVESKMKEIEELARRAEAFRRTDLFQ